MSLFSSMKEKFFVVFIGIEKYRRAVENPYYALLILFLRFVNFTSTNGQFYIFYEILTSSRRLNGRTLTATLIATSDMIGEILSLYKLVITNKTQKFISDLIK